MRVRAFAMFHPIIVKKFGEPKHDTFPMYRARIRATREEKRVRRVLMDIVPFNGVLG
jgi:hypothetical protein